MKEITAFSYLDTSTVVFFTILGRPITKKNNPMVVPGKRRVLPSPQFQKYQKEAVKQLLPQMLNYSVLPIDDPVVVEAKYWMKDRSSWPDYMGLIQATADILEHVGIIGNDSQIVTFKNSLIAGIDPDNPRVDIQIRTMKKM